MWRCQQQRVCLYILYSATTMGDSEGRLRIRMTDRSVPPPVRGRAPRLLVLATLAAALPLTACGRDYEGGGDLRAQRVVLEREVEGLRAMVTRMERGEPMLPRNDIAVAVEEALVRDLLIAQLPFEADVDRFHVQLTSADVQFRGSPTLQLRGRIVVRDQPDLTAAVTVFGALDDVRVDQTSSTLLATVAADHLTIADVTGAAQFLSGETIDEVARLVRVELSSQLPTLRIPVRLQPSIDFPAVTEGPVRIDGARLPLDVVVSQVVAARGRLWVSVHVTPGAFVATPDAGARR